MSYVDWTQFAGEMRDRLEEHPDLVDYRKNLTERDPGELLVETRASARRGELWIRHDDPQSESSEIPGGGVDDVVIEPFEIILIVSAKRARAEIAAALAAVEQCLLGVYLDGADEAIRRTAPWRRLIDETSDMRAVYALGIEVLYDDVRTEVGYVVARASGGYPCGLLLALTRAA